MSNNTTTGVPRPPFDPELEAALVAIAGMVPPTITPEMVPMMKQATPTEPLDQLLQSRGATRRDVTIEGHLGDEIVLTIIEAEGREGTGPGFYYTHGGGMISGDRFSAIEPFVEWALDHEGVLVSVQYRLAPDFPDPYPVEDCYAGLLWFASQFNELGVDPARVIICGTSAGGGLAAGTSLLSRDRSGPALAGQMLIYPMLDDRDTTLSSAQIDGVGVWDRESNRTGWGALLGERRGSDEVSIYAAPARATDLSGLPPAFIDVGSAEVFRDEDIAYATAIWAAGGEAELHVWPGVFHGADLLAPHAQISREMVAARNGWITRILSR
ncbi:MAG: alpha/beta hydrolase [Actinobacteria bacterium]|nr:alpha/beta hydrolase [Actinomycetota bacterium]